ASGSVSSNPSTAKLHNLDGRLGPLALVRFGERITLSLCPQKTLRSIDLARQAKRAFPRHARRLAREAPDTLAPSLAPLARNRTSDSGRRFAAASPSGTIPIHRGFAPRSSLCSSLHPRCAPAHSLLPSRQKSLAGFQANQCRPAEVRPYS